MYLGVILFVIGMLLVGQGTFIPNRLWLICVGLGIIGVAGGLVMINTNTAMMNTEI